MQVYSMYVKYEFNVTTPFRLDGRGAEHLYLEGFFGGVASYSFDEQRAKHQRKMLATS